MRSAIEPTVARRRRPVSPRSSLAIAERWRQQPFLVPALNPRTDRSSVAAR